MPNESPEYRAARDKLLDAEVALRRQVETVAKMRRELPLGGEVAEYVFENETGKATLKDLFAGKDTLAIYSYMFGPDRQQPCNMCTPLIDGMAATAEHIGQRLSLVIVAESPIARLLDFARKRGWNKLRLASCAGNRYNADYYGKGEKGGDTTMLNVFCLRDGKVFHFWGTEMTQAVQDPGQDHRAIDFLSPVFNLLDATPEGRGDFYTKLNY
jgi:predicted dithiol-disulfide oxidoreductase (DUF899 family)